MNPYSYKRINIGVDDEAETTEQFTIPRQQQPRQQQPRRAPTRESYKLQHTRENYMSTAIPHPQQQLETQQQVAPQPFQRQVQPLQQTTSATMDDVITQISALDKKMTDFASDIKTRCDELKPRRLIFRAPCPRPSGDSTTCSFWSSCGCPSSSRCSYYKSS